MATNIENIEQISTKELNEIIKDLGDCSGHRLQTFLIGFYDSAGRFFLADCFETDSSLKVRYPSRAWPHSVLKHTSTKRFQKQLKSLVEQELKRREA